jgi:hypothetical protein
MKQILESIRHARRLGVLGTLIIAGCAHTGDAFERAPLTKPIKSYSSVAILLAAGDPAAVNAAQKVNICKSSLTSKMTAGRVFNDVMNESAQDQAQLLMKVTMIDAQDGNSFSGAMSGGVSKVALAVDLVDPKDNASIGKFDVTGNSTTGTKTTVMGVNTDTLEDTMKRACDAAGDQMVEYLRSKSN